MYIFRAEPEECRNWTLVVEDVLQPMSNYCIRKVQHIVFANVDSYFVVTYLNILQQYIANEEVIVAQQV